MKVREILHLLHGETMVVRAHHCVISKSCHIDERSSHMAPGFVCTHHLPQIAIPAAQIAGILLCFHVGGVKPRPGL